MTSRDEASLPSGGGDVVLPMVVSSSDRDPAGLEVGPMEVSLMVTTNFWPREQWTPLGKCRCEQYSPAAATEKAIGLLLRVVNGEAVLQLSLLSFGTYATL